MTYSTRYCLNIKVTLGESAPGYSTVTYKLIQLTFNTVS